MTPHARARRDLPKAVSLIALTLLLAASSRLLVRNGTRVFDFFDMSAFMDAAYRVARGQRVYSDFQFNAGPVHLYLYAAFIKLFGFGRTAVLGFMCAVNVAALLLTYGLARLRLPALSALAITSLAAVAFFGPISHPWYDQTAWLWILAGLFAVEHPRLSPRTRGAAAGAAAALTLLTKSNVGAAGGFTLLAVLLARQSEGLKARKGRSELKASLMAFVAASLAVSAVLLLTLHEPLEFIRQSLSYMPMARLGEQGRLRFVVLHTFFAPLALLGALACATGGRRFIGRQRVAVVALFGLALASIFTTWTGSMVLTTNFPMVGVVLLYLVALLRKLPSGHAPRALVALAAAYSIFIVLDATGRTYRLQAWMWRPGDGGTQQVADYELTDPALKGWRCNGATGRGLDATARYLREQIPPQDDVLVLPDSTVLYGMSGRESYRGAPFIFHVGEFPLPGRHYLDFISGFDAHPPRWLVVHDQEEVSFYSTTSILKWLKLEKALDERYERVWRFEAFNVYRLKERPRS